MSCRLQVQRWAWRRRIQVGGCTAGRRQWQSTASLVQEESLLPASTSAVPEGRTLPILASLILTRPPLLTAAPSAFERAYYAYHQRLEYATSAPFHPDFYFKKGSIGESVYRARERQLRLEMGQGAAELTDRALGENEREVMAKGDAAYREEMDSIKPLPRTSEGAESSLRSLDRALDEHLILLVKAEGEEQWTFPTTLVGQSSQGASRENLHQATVRGVRELCGVDMNYWILTKAPVAHLTWSKAADEVQDQFFLKGHVLAGQAQTQRPKTEDFAWLTRSECKARLSVEVWTAVEDAL